MLSAQNIESELSYAYLHAVASRAGVICELTGRHSDDAGVDATLRVKGRLAPDSVLAHFPVDVQLKATRRQPSVRNNRYSLSLPLKNYDDLRSTATAPQLLVVLFLPTAPEEWLSHSARSLVLRRCAFWASLRAASENETSKTVYVPTRNVVSVEGLGGLLARISRREVLNYEG